MAVSGEKTPRMDDSHKEDKILIVDDSDLVRKVVKQELEKKGFSTIEANSGEQAISVFTSTPVSLITLDIDMPTMNGYETCRLIREQENILAKKSKDKGRVPVVFVTANDGIRERAKGFEVGACDYIVKSSGIGSDVVKSALRYLRPDKVYENERVLVVEDSEVQRLMIEQWVRSIGAKVESACNGVEAFDRLQSNPHNFHAIIIDHLMPRMQGLDLCRLSRKIIGLRIPILMITAVTDRDTQLSFFQAGATDYLVKPFFREELVARLSVHLDTFQRSSELEKLTKESQGSAQLIAQLASITAADENSPLSKLKKASSLLSEICSKSPPARAQELLEAINGGIDQLDSMLKKLLPSSVK